MTTAEIEVGSIVEYQNFNEELHHRIKEGQIYCATCVAVIQSQLTTTLPDQALLQGTKTVEEIAVLSDDAHLCAKTLLLEIVDENC